MSFQKAIFFRDNSDKQVIFLKKLLFVVFLAVVILVVLIVFLEYKKKNKRLLEEQFTNALLSQYYSLNYSNNNILTVQKDCDSELNLLIRISDMCKKQDFVNIRNLLQKIIFDKSYSSWFESFCRVLLLNIILDNNTISYDDNILVEQLLNCSNQKENVFINLINLMKASWCIKNGNFSEAKTLLTNLLSVDDLPYIIKCNAEWMLYSLLSIIN